MKIEQYRIAIVNLDPTVGSEIRKTRPCVIVSPDEINRQLRTVTVVPVTSSSRAYPTRVSVALQSKNSWVAIDQIRTIDKARITKVASRLSADEIARIKDVIKETFVD